MSEPYSRWTALTLRLHSLERRALILLARRNCTTLSGELRAALRETLRREGLWPPPEWQPPAPSS